MSAPDGFKLAEELRNTFLSYLTSALPVGNHKSQRQLGQRFYDEWATELFAGPLVEALPVYERVGSLDDYFGDARGKESPEFRFAAGMNVCLSWADVDHRFPQFRKVRDSIWPPHSDEAEEEEEDTSANKFWRRRLYAHQWESFEKIAREQRNLIVATSTGSGKTECYVIPLLYHLLTETTEQRRNTGVRALLLYPMNALVEDQMHRLRQLLFWINLSRYVKGNGRPITFGRYTGATPVAANDRHPERQVSPEAMHGLGELVYRTEMQATPPDILVTNFTMLEYMLLRDDDQQLFARPEHFRFLVLDEVHTYTGTQGMEVALLLRRLRAFLQRRSGRRASFQAIGTSATLPSGADARRSTAEFATTLFGVSFGQSDVIRPEHKQPDEPLSFTQAYRTDVLECLSGFDELFPKLAGHMGLHDATDLSEVPDTEWNLLAELLGATIERRDDAPRVEHLWQRLGQILQNSPVLCKLRFVLTKPDPSCIGLDEVSHGLFGSGERAKRATAVLLKLVGAAHVDGMPILPIRFHMFVQEPSSAQLCIRPSCTDGTEWWSRVTLSHHTRCEHCSSFMYPMLLCRRCGFAYLEGWRRRFASGQLGPDLLPEPDDADEEASYERVIFRPLKSDIPQEAVSFGEQQTLCLACGRFMVSNENAAFQRIANHDCGSESQIQVISWHKELHNGVLEECVFCDQHWIKGQDVATPPAPSVYATATVLVEELERGIERNGVDPFESKLISFSDSRQQAAQLAYRFQKTNREFTFRQLMWQVISQQSSNGILTADLVDELYREARDDERVRRLIVDDERYLNNRVYLEKSVSTLLFREAVTAYLTLEAQGIVRIGYDSVLFENIHRVLQSDPILFSRLNESEQQSFLLFLLDWNMRFRYAIAPSPPPNGGLDVDWQWLESRYILPKSCVRAKADSARGELSFVVSMATGRNRLFNFCQRLYKRVNSDRFRPELSLSDLQQSLFAMWDNILADYVSRQPGHASKSLWNVGRDDPQAAVLKLAFDALRWSSVADDATLYRCDACGRVSGYSIAGVCPLRDCNGSLQRTTGHEIDREQFSPVRHYRQLVRYRKLRPLRVEEHTAQVAAIKRQSIEQDFRCTGPESVDVICGSTTFELGIDLGTIHAVFMSNLPPRVSNYRQRAGRAGRRCGMVPFILSYVRQRPHDQYFWKRLSHFIAGPVTVPHLKVGSLEVIGRHINALFTRELLRQVSDSRNERVPLDGPPAGGFVGHVLSRSLIPEIEQSLTNPHGELRAEFEAAFGDLIAAERPVAAADRLGKRLRTLQATYLPLRELDGAISVLSDYGILPSYAFPLYVDELRLNHAPTDRPPRSELKLQRDRRIALQEYMPGKVFVAGKTMIVSDGVWAGYEERFFRVCTNRDCQSMDFTENAAHICPACHSQRNTLTALIPRSGFFGSQADSINEQDTELVRQRGETYFDPANEPPPVYNRYGNAMNIAIIGSSVMEQAASRPRMRQFNPRPYSDLTLELVPSAERDLALPAIPPAHCLKRGSGALARRFHLMHEFTTDIVRIQVLPNETGHLLASSPVLQGKLTENVENMRRRYYWDCFRRSLGEALVAAASQLLDIDQSEIGITFHPSVNVVGGKELILYDTAPGGAGYATQAVQYIRDIFETAETILASCDCGDSCYSCLRSYNNQMFHQRLNRHYVLVGLQEFNRRNWSTNAIPVNTTPFAFSS
ncbi:MAG: DEAD/DEAH box helicase [Candidatus Sulfotelmatobacter sp.]